MFNPIEKLSTTALEKAKATGFEMRIFNNRKEFNTALKVHNMNFYKKTEEFKLIKSRKQCRDEKMLNSIRINALQARNKVLTELIKTLPKDRKSKVVEKVSQAQLDRLYSDSHQGLIPEFLYLAALKTFKKQQAAVVEIDAEEVPPQIENNK